MGKSPRRVTSLSACNFLCGVSLSLPLGNFSNIMLKCVHSRSSVCTTARNMTRLGLDRGLAGHQRPTLGKCSPGMATHLSNPCCGPRRGGSRGVAPPAGTPRPRSKRWWSRLGRSPGAVKVTGRPPGSQQAGQHPTHSPTPQTHPP